MGTNKIDREQRRYEIATRIPYAIYSTRPYNYNEAEMVISKSIKAADKMLKQLKEEENV